MSRRGALALALVVAWGTASCGGGAAEPVPAPTTVADANGLGAACNLAAPLGQLASTADASCPEGVCLADQRGPARVYCTVDCSLQACPPGWACESSLPFGRRVCTGSHGAGGGGQGNLRIDVARFEINDAKPLAPGVRSLRRAAPGALPPCNTFAAASTPVAGHGTELDVTATLCTDVRAYTFTLALAQPGAFVPEFGVENAFLGVTSRERGTGIVKGRWSGRAVVAVTASTQDDLGAFTDVAASFELADPEQASAVLAGTFVFSASP